MELFGTKSSGPGAPKRGRKGLDLVQLDRFDRECHKAFHRLCKGTASPLDAEEAQYVDRGLKAEEESLEEDAKSLQRMTLPEFWTWCEGFHERPFASHQKMAIELRSAAIASAASRLQETRELREELRLVIEELTNPRRIKSRDACVAAWRALWHALDGAEVLAACRKWAALPRRYQDPVFCKEVEKVREPLAMAMNTARFPRSEGADKGRITFLARTMAGLMLGVSPTTAEERLRKVSHQPGHPLWSKEGRCCTCWRCVAKRRTRRRKEIGRSKRINGSR
jgi:hypothetical protein